MGYLDKQKMVQKHLQELEGEMLTIAEATTPIDQVSAAKALIRKAFRNRITLVLTNFHSGTSPEDEDLTSTMQSSPDKQQ